MRFVPIESLRPPKWLGVYLVAVLAMLSLLGCSKDKTTNPNPNPNPVTGSTTYTGSVAGAGANGTLTITVATDSPAPQNVGFRAHTIVSASGTFKRAGQPDVSLTGDYNDGSKQLAVSGGGWMCRGGLMSSRLEGSVSGPTGEAGFFSLIEGSTGVTVIIGRFTSTTMPPGRNGDFNISVSGTQVHGTAVADGVGGQPIPLDGTYDPANGAISIVNPAPGATAPLAIGNYDSMTGDASGTYNTGLGDSGTWMGTKQ